MSDFDSDPAPPRWVFMLLVIVSLAVAGAIIFVAFPSKGAVKEPCMDPAMREEVRQLVLSGIDQALIRHVGHVFDIWMKDPAEQPRRAIIGMHQAIDAYVRSRASALRWSPPTCER
jgi:hypothetical protein